MIQGVTEFVSLLKRRVESLEGDQSVQGEVGSCQRAGSGHVYFTLKDDRCQLQCVLYRYQAAACRIQLQKGMQVELSGRATVWEGRGSLQFVVHSLKLAGQGSLQQRFEELKARLAQEGLFDSSRKKAIPAWPASVGLITSASGAVIEDMRHRLESRAPWMQAYLLPVTVQGAGAELGLARAVEAWGSPEGRHLHGLPDVDYLILARGGGSLEDLWCFNEEILARAIAACPIPIISAVGHETDFTIADFVADLRAPTPTAAIELSTPDAVGLAQWYDDSEQRLKRRATHVMEQADLRLRLLEQSRFRRPEECLSPFAQKLDALEADFVQSYEQRLQDSQHMLDLAEARLSLRSVQQRLQERDDFLRACEQKLKHLAKTCLQQAEAQVNTLAARLRATSPQNALDRGFALVQNEQGKLVRQASSLLKGERLKISLAQGSRSVRVEDEPM